KILGYLGSINEAKIINMSANNTFWERVDTHLKALHLETSQRKAIKQQLQRRIPKVPDNELYKMTELENRHPRMSRGFKGRNQLEEFRAKYHLPGDEIRSL